MICPWCGHVETLAERVARLFAELRAELATPGRPPS